MSILTRVLSNGQKVLLSRRGNQSLMQVLDSTDNVVFTRCKSVKRMTVPANPKAETRTSIGFVPQQLKSHTNDLTRRQIGFLPADTKPVRHKTNAPRDKYSIITKCDFDSNMDNVCVNAVQRKYTANGNIRVKQMSPNEEIFAVSSQQSTLLKEGASEHALIIKDFEKKLTTADDYAKTFDDRTDLLKKRHSEVLNLTSQIEQEINEVYANGLKNENYAAYWNKIAPQVENPKVMKCVNGLKETFLNVRDTICAKIDKLSSQQEEVIKMRSSLETQINEHQEMIKSINKQLDVYRNNFKKIKGHFTPAEEETRRQVCDLQKQISSLLAKQI